MATSFKNLDSAKDSVVTRNLLHEAIPISSIVSEPTVLTTLKSLVMHVPVSLRLSILGLFSKPYF